MCYIPDLFFPWLLRFLEPDLEKHFNCQHDYRTKSGYSSSYLRTGEYRHLKYDQHFTPIVWGAGFTEEIEQILALDGEESAFKSLSYRLVDAYGLFDLLISKNQKRAKRITQQEVQTS